MRPGLMTDLVEFTIIQARARLKEIVSDLEYYRSVASHEMPESPHPPEVDNDDEDHEKFEKENRKWHRKMKKWDEKFERQMDAQNQVYELTDELHAIGQKFPGLRSAVDSILGPEFDPFA